MCHTSVSVVIMHFTMITFVLFLCAFSQRETKPVWWIPWWRLCSQGPPSVIGENGHHATVRQTADWQNTVFRCHCALFVVSVSFTCLQKNTCPFKLVIAFLQHCCLSFKLNVSVKVPFIHRLYPCATVSRIHCTDTALIHVETYVHINRGHRKKGRHVSWCRSLEIYCPFPIHEALNSRAEADLENIFHSAMMNRPCPEEYHLVGAQGSIDMQVRALQKSHRCCCLHTGNHIRKKERRKKDSWLEWMIVL